MPKTTKTAAATKKTATKTTAGKKASTKAATGKKTATKKTATKAATGKKTATKKAATGEAPAKKPKSELRKPQLRILQALQDGSTLDRKAISLKAPVDVATCVEYLGSHDPEKRAKNDEKHFKSLITWGYVKLEKHDVDGKDTHVYSITPAGKKYLDSLE